MPYFIGPVIASLLMTGLVSGRAGFHALGARLLKWRVGTRWFAVALLTAPFLMGLLAFLLSLFSREFLPIVVTAEDKVGVVVRGIMVGLIFGGLPPNPTLEQAAKQVQLGSTSLGRCINA